ncbi:MAG: hypothetical protein ACR5LH_10520, partial [Sodalis sp. (in: enterobacteria)]
CCVWATLLKPDVARSGKGNSPVPCTAWADQKWSTIPRSYLVATGNHAQLHTVEQNLSILEPLNLAITDRSCSMYFTAADKVRGETLLC